LFSGVIGFALIMVSLKMASLHPMEHLYMNSLAGEDREKIKNNFESDYWGLAEREVLEEVLKKDSSPQITILAENTPGELNALVLSPNDRARIRYTKKQEEADYYIADYRWRKAEDYPYKKEVYSVMIGNAKIATAFKVKKPAELYNSKNSRTLLSFQQDFENPQKPWTNSHVIVPPEGAFSGKNATMTDSISEYSDALELTGLDKLVGNKNVFVKASFRLLDRVGGSASKFVISIETKEGVAYFWQPIKEIQNEAGKESLVWEEITGALELPVIRNKEDKIKIYLLNLGKKRILTDDYKISFAEEAQANQ
jgi:hypothetical protein